MYKTTQSKQSKPHQKGNHNRVLEINVKSYKIKSSCTVNVTKSVEVIRIQIHITPNQSKHEIIPQD